MNVRIPTAFRIAIATAVTAMLLAPLLTASPEGVSAQETAAAPATPAPVPVIAAALPAQPTSAPIIGSETGLPLPRYVSLKASRTFARRGPSNLHRIDWVYTRRDLPLRVTGEFDNWRRVEDNEGQGGWISYHLLSGVRTVLVTQDMVALHARPQAEAPEVAYLETGVVARIRECVPAWCEIQVEGARGWIDRNAVWGVEPGEVLD